MEVTYTHCAGLDVHKKTIVACGIVSSPGQKSVRTTQTFGTWTSDLLALSDWLSGQGITHVAMESTGEYWKPVYNLLEANFTLLVVNAQHIKNVPGRKTDVKDAEWIADLLRHGLVRGSLIPPLPQRDLRDLTRQRTKLVQEKAAVVNRLQKVLEWSNIKLASVVTDVTGVSARAMLKALVAGVEDVRELADKAKGRLRSKRQQLEGALNGNVRSHHRFLLTHHLTHLDFLEAQIAIFDDQIQTQILAQTLSPQSSSNSSGDTIENNLRESDDSPLTGEQAIILLDTIPGVGQATGEMLLAEIGLDMSRFQSAAHLAKWAKLCPGNHESAGKRYSGHTGQANSWLRTGLVQAAHAAVKCKGTYLRAIYHRLVQRRGHKKAIIAIAHKILKAAYYILSKREPYQELGANYLHQHHSQQLLKRMCRRFSQLGYQVSLTPNP